MKSTTLSPFGHLQAGKPCLLLLLLLAPAFLLLPSGLAAHQQATLVRARHALGAASSSSPSSSPGKRPLPPQGMGKLLFLGDKSGTSFSLGMAHTQPQAEVAEEPAWRSLWEQTHVQSTSADWGSRAVLFPLHDSLVLQGYQFGSNEYAWRRLEMDRTRMRHMARGRMVQQQQQGAQSENDTILTTNVLTGEYVNLVTVYLGTPPQPMVVNFDTGSSALWVACDCTNCTTPPVEPFYKNASSTGQVVDEQKCAALAMGTPLGTWQWNATTSVCVFGVLYVDNAGARGEAAVDLMTIDGITPQLQNGSVQGYVSFGCADQFTSGTDGVPALGTPKATGLIGAGPSNDSFLWALANQQVLPWVFAVCLDSTNGNGSKLVLGRAPTPTSFSTIPMEIKTKNGKTLPFYYATVTQMSVAGSPIAGTSGATVIFDTGSSSSLLPQPSFDSFKSLIEANLGVRLEWVALAGWCLPRNQTGREDADPYITLTFPNGATLVVPTSLYFFFPNHGCLNVRVGHEFTLGAPFIANQYLLFDVENQQLGWAPTNCSTGEPLTTPAPPPTPIATPPLPSSPAPTAAPPPSPSGGDAASISCSLEASWQQGGQSYSQYTCLLSNSGTDPLLNLSLSCLHFNPTSTWNINPDCSLPSTTLWPHQTTSLGYITTASTPATLTVASYSSPSPAISVSPASLPNSAVTLACASAQPPFVSGSQLVYQFQCTLSNGGLSNVSEVKLQCTNYFPTQSWNIDPQCHLLQPGLYPGQSYNFGFQTNLPNPTFGLASAA